MTFFEFSHASTGHSFQAIDTQIFRRIDLLLESSPLKNFGGRTPLGVIVFPIVFQDIDLKMCVRYGSDPGKTRLKHFHDRIHSGRARAMNVRACRQGRHQPRVASVCCLLVTYSHVTVTVKISRG